MYKQGRVLIYLCKIDLAEQIIHRHYTSHVSVCRLIRDMDFGEFKKLLPIEAARLAQLGEIQITEPDIISKITGIPFSGREYLRLVLEE